MTRVYLVQFSDYLEQRILGGFASEAEAQVFLEKQKREGYGWFEILEVEVGKPFALRSIAKKFISGGREIDPADFEDLFEDPYGDDVWDPPEGEPYQDRDEDLFDPEDHL